MNQRVLFKPGLSGAGDALKSAQAVVKLAPSPARRIVGTLSQTQPVWRALGLEALDVEA